MEVDVGLGKRETPITLLRGGRINHQAVFTAAISSESISAAANIQFRMYIDKRFCDAVIEVRFIIVTDCREYNYHQILSKQVTRIYFTSITASKEHYNCYNTDYIYII